MPSNRCMTQSAGHGATAAAGDRRSTCCKNGFSLVEVTVATLLVGLLLIAALQNLGASVRGGVATQLQAVGTQLAYSVLSEILTVAYSDPESNAAFGREIDEPQNPVRADLDDVDDFHNWTESPPRDRVGNDLGLPSQWELRVMVDYVDPLDLTQNVATDQGVKRITVEAWYATKRVATAVAHQTADWISMIPEPGNNRTTGSLPPGNRAPTAVASAAPRMATEVITTWFDGTASYDPDDDALTYTWDFGDGTSGTGITVVHIYTNETGNDKVFQATLIVTDVNGATGVDHANITVLED